MYCYKRVSCPHKHNTNILPLMSNMMTLTPLWQIFNKPTILEFSSMLASEALMQLKRYLAMIHFLNQKNNSCYIKQFKKKKYFKSKCGKYPKYSKIYLFFVFLDYLVTIILLNQNQLCYKTIGFQTIWFSMLLIFLEDSHIYKLMKLQEIRWAFMCGAVLLFYYSHQSTIIKCI